MSLTDGQPGCGTWLRDAEGTLSLLIGTIEQPKLEAAGGQARCVAVVGRRACIMCCTLTDHSNAAALRTLRGPSHAPLSASDLPTP
eukprot:1284009-Prymnesium_polylepis.1